MRGREISFSHCVNCFVFQLLSSACRNWQNCVHTLSSVCVVGWRPKCMSSPLGCYSVWVTAGWEFVCVSEHTGLVKLCVYKAMSAYIALRKNHICAVWLWQCWHKAARLCLCKIMSEIFLQLGGVVKSGNSESFTARRSCAKLYKGCLYSSKELCSHCKYVHVILQVCTHICTQQVLQL